MLIPDGNSVTITADYYGDGKPETAIWNPDTSEWFIPRNDKVLRKSSDYHIIKLGMRNDIPVLADYNGDGELDIAVWRPSNGNWYISNTNDFQTHSGTDYTVVQCGSDRYGDIPVPADYDGDGLAEVAVWRPSNGTWYISYDNSSWLTITGHGYAEIQFGGTGDIPVPADYDGDKKVEIAVWRPSEGNWYISYDNQSWVNKGTAYDILHLGVKDDVPLPKDWDNDGKAEIAVGRPSDGKLYISTENRSWEDKGNTYIITEWQR